MSIVISVAQGIIFIVAVFLPFLGTAIFTVWLQSLAGLTAALPLAVISVAVFGSIEKWLYNKKPKLKEKGNEQA